MTNRTEDAPSSSQTNNSIHADDSFEAKIVTITEAEAIKLTASTINERR